MAHGMDETMMEETMMDGAAIQVPEYDEDLDEAFHGPGYSYPEFFDDLDEEGSQGADILRDHIQL